MPVTAALTNLPKPKARPPGLVPWKPGQSGNPGGRTKLEAEVRRLAQSMSVEAMNRCAEIMRSSDERAALVAINTILDRAYGKPKEAQASDDTSKPDLSVLNAKQLAALRSIVKAMVVAGVMNEPTEAPSPDQPAVSEPT